MALIPDGARKTWVCGAMTPPLEASASATRHEEGEVTLTSTIDAKAAAP